MKYLFIITGVAYGHLTRQESIISRLEKLDRNAEIVIAGYNTSYNYFKKKYKVIKLEPIYFGSECPRVKTFEILSKNNRLISNWIKNYHIIKSFRKSFNPNVTVSDWEPFSLFLKDCYMTWNYKPFPARTLSFIFQKFLLNVLFSVIKLVDKRIIIPSIMEMKDTRNFLYFPLIIRKFPDEVKEKKGYKNSIVVMIGGSDFGISLARKIRNVSKNFNEKFVFFGLKCKSENCIGFRGFRGDYLSFLKSSKAVISLAGYSGLSEALVYKKPNLIFPIKNWIEQDSVAREFEDYVKVGSIESSEAEIKDILENFLLNLENYKKRLDSLEIKDGAREVAEFLYREASS